MVADREMTSNTNGSSAMFRLFPSFTHLFVACLLLVIPGLAGSASGEAADAAYSEWYDLYTAEQLEEALELAASRITADSSAAFGWAALSLSLEGLGYFDKALWLAGESLLRDSSSALGWVALGMAEVSSDSGDGAFEFELARELDPALAIVSFGTGYAAMSAEDYEGAIAGFSESIMLDSSYVSGWRSLAVSLRLSARQEEASTLLDRALLLWPEDPWFWEEKGYVLELLELYDVSAHAYDRAIELDPADTYALRRRGLLFERDSNYEAAIEMYRMVIDADPADAWTYGELGFCYDQLGQPKKAEQWYLDGIEVDPDYAWAALRIGLIAMDRGELESASYWLEYAVDADPLMTDAWVNLGLVSEDLGSFGYAVECYEHALEIDPEDYWTWGELGYVLEQLGRYDEAAVAYERGVLANEQYMWGWQQRGLLYEEEGEYTKAIGWYRDALASAGESAWMLGELGYLLEGEADFDSARLCYREALEIDSCYVFGLIRLGRLELDAGRFDVVQDLFERYLACGGDEVTGWLQLSLMFEEMGHAEEADSCAFQGLAVDPDGWISMAEDHFYSDRPDEAEHLLHRSELAEPVSAYSWIRIADIYDAMGMRSEADRCYGIAIETEPENPAVLYDYGVTLSAREDYDAAQETFLRALEMDSTDVDTWSMLGEAYLFDGRYTEALEALQRAVELDPSSVFSISYVGLVYERMGRPLDAMEYYLQALELSPGYSYAHDRIAAIVDPSYDADWWSRDAHRLNASVSLDFSAETGNREELDLVASAEVTYRYNDMGSQIALEGSCSLEEVNDRETENSAYAALSADYYFTDAIYLEASTSWDRQPLTVRPWQISSYLAAGYRKWLGEWIWVSPEIGVGMVSSKWSLRDEVSDLWSAYASTGIWCEPRGWPDLWLGGSLYYPPQHPEDYEFFGNLELGFDIWKPLSLTLGYSVDYTNRPLISLWEKLDSEYYTRLTFSLH